MNYKEFLRVRNMFFAFVITLVAIGLFVGLLSGGSKVNVSVDAPANAGGHVAAVSASSNTGTTNVQAPGIVVSGAEQGVPFAILLAVASFVAAIFATVVGTCLAAENCGHLELAWTRPASRVAYAARLMAVDVVGIAAIFIFTLAFSLALIYAKGWQGYIYKGEDVMPFVGRFAAYPLAWFGLVAALTASVRARAGAIAGFSWAAAGLLIILLTLNSLPPAIHAVLEVVNHLNPLFYGSYAESGHHFIGVPNPLAIAGLLGIAIVGIAASLAQWRRLEA
jgi:hypothetical protein